VNIRKQDGFTLIDLLFVCGLIGVLSAIALPRLLLAKQTADAASAIGSLRTINSGELTFASTCGAGFYAPDLPTLGATPPGSNEAFVSPGLTSANAVTKSGYVIQLSGTAFANAPASCNGLAAGSGAPGFKAAADPVVPSNGRYFATNSNASIYEHTATLWVAMPEVGLPPVGHPLE
jgi:type IV pilus assembly protein PilA